MAELDVWFERVHSRWKGGPDRWRLTVILHDDFWEAIVERRPVSEKASVWVEQEWEIAR